MSAVLPGVLSLFAIILLIALTVLVTPVKLGLAIRTWPGWRLRIAVRLLGGLTPQIAVHDSARPGSKRRKPKPTRKRGAGGARHGPERFGRLAISAPRLVAGFLRPIRLERLKIDADIGFPDPADTGQLMGLIAAARVLAPSIPSLSIAVRPEFSGPCARGELDAELSFVPAAFIGPGVRLASHLLGSRE